MGNNFHPINEEMDNKSTDGEGTKDGQNKVHKTQRQQSFP